MRRKMLHKAKLVVRVESDKESGKIRSTSIYDNRTLKYWSEDQVKSRGCEWFLNLDDLKGTLNWNLNGDSARSRSAPSLRMITDERSYEMKPWSRVKIETDEYQGKGHLVRQAEAAEGDDRDFWVVLTDDGEMMTLLPSEFEVADGPKPAILCPGLRPCRGVYWNGGKKIDVVGRFHGWGSDYEEFCDYGPGNFSIGIIEQDDGTVVMCRADTIVFLDRETGKEGSEQGGRVCHPEGVHAGK